MRRRPFSGVFYTLYLEGDAFRGVMAVSFFRRRCAAIYRRNLRRSAERGRRHALLMRPPVGAKESVDGSGQTEFSPKNPSGECPGKEPCLGSLLGLLRRGTPAMIPVLHGTPECMSWAHRSKRLLRQMRGVGTESRRGWGWRCVSLTVYDFSYS